MESLHGKHALVTGAGSGIGKATAIALALSGASVTVHYAHNATGAEAVVTTIREMGGTSFAVQADLSQRSSISRLHQIAVGQYGHIDILVNNAGIGALHTVDRITDISETDWDKVMEVNVTAPALLCKLVLPEMVEHRSGAIVNISSIRGMLGNPTLSVYCTSKGALTLLTRQLACDYSPFNIRVNCICPGFVASEMFKSYVEKQEDPEGALATFASMAPLNRVGLPEEIAKVVVFFASEAASFIKGVVFPVDGGYTATGIRRVL